MTKYHNPQLLKEYDKVIRLQNHPQLLKEYDKVIRLQNITLNCY